MSAKTIQSIGFINTQMKHLAALALVVMVIQIQQANAQNLDLQNMTITTTEVFSANSITAGPDFTVGSTGDVILSAETIAIKPQFFVVNGGKLQIVSGATPVSVETEDPILPDEFILNQNFPNPFNPATEIRFQLPEATLVVLTIYNALGQEIRTLVNQEYQAGFHSVNWDGKNSKGNPVSSGVYLYKLEVGSFSQIKKMSLIR